MGKIKLGFLIAALLVVSALLRPRTGNEETIYRSLDVLAEILTVVRQFSPENVESEKLVEGAIDGLLKQLDPHSSYYDQDRYRTMREDQSGSFYGIGIIVGYQNEQLTVIAPIEGAPAFEAGIRAGDFIAQIEGKDTESMDLYEGIRMLRGDEGTSVLLTIMRIDIEEPLEFELQRAEIPTTNVRTSFMLDERTGYVALKDFGETAEEELVRSIKELESQSMSQLILDLRGNPGGLLPQAIAVASLFLPDERLVVSTRGRLRNASQKYYSTMASPLSQTPLIVLIDRGSASASEIVAGAIQDHDRGLIVGVSSWGKGLVQSVFPMARGTKGLALTTSRYYTPSGRNIQGNYDSLEAYYNPESSESLYFGTDEKEHRVFKTIHGRDVLEARGITPDVYISFPKVPPLVRKLEAKHTAFFNFATQYQKTVKPTGQDWVADQAVLDLFERYLDEKGSDTENLKTYAEQIRQKITYQCLYIVNPNWAWHFLIEGDHQILAAMGLFSKARELLTVYNGEGALSEGYTWELKHYAKLNQPKQIAKEDP